MNRPGLTRNHIIWIKTGLPQKEKTPHGVNQIKIKCCVQQIRLRGATALLFSFEGRFLPLLPPLQLNLLPLLLMRLIIIRSTAVLSYHRRLLSSLSRVTIGGTYFFFCTGSHRAQFLLERPAPGWWPLRSSWCHPHRGRAWVRAFCLSLFRLFLSPWLPAHSSVRVWPSLFTLSVRRRCTVGVEPDDETELQYMDREMFGWNRCIHPLMSVIQSCTDDPTIHLTCVWVFWTYGGLRDGWRSGADCPNAILASAFVKPGVVDGHHAPDLWKISEGPTTMHQEENSVALWVDEQDTLRDSEREGDVE